nr:MAG TPA: Laccase-1 [Caudoviricetes sp.]
MYLNWQVWFFHCHKLRYLPFQSNTAFYPK